MWHRGQHRQFSPTAAVSPTGRPRDTQRQTAQEPPRRRRCPPVPLLRSSSCQRRHPYHSSCGCIPRNAAPRHPAACFCGAQVPVPAPRGGGLRRCRGARALPCCIPGHGGSQPVALLPHEPPPRRGPQGDGGGRCRGGKLRGRRRILAFARRTAASFPRPGRCWVPYFHCEVGKKMATF